MNHTCLVIFSELVDGGKVYRAGKGGKGETLLVKTFAFSPHNTVNRVNHVCNLSHCILSQCIPSCHHLLDEDTSCHNLFGGNPQLGYSKSRRLQLRIRCSIINHWSFSFLSGRRGQDLRKKQTNKIDFIFWVWAQEKGHYFVLKIDSWTSTHTLY